MSDQLLTIVADARPFAEAMERVTAALESFTREFCIGADGNLRRWDQHHPRPLPINGREYHRRQRSRRRR